VITCAFEDGHRALLRHVVVHAVVERNGALLLVKRAQRLLEGGKWGLPGGFLDRDETLADGVLRELREETGWEGRVAALLRVNSRPDRPREDRQNVAFDFVIAPVRQSGAPDDESTDVQWIPLGALPALETLAFDHGDTVRAYLDARRTGLATPMLL
jgi:ADP-ribose pyrophosphatase YjhB (NUDIX family)